MSLRTTTFSAASATVVAVLAVLGAATPAGAAPTPTPSPTVTTTATAVPTPSPTATTAPAATPTPTASATPTATPTASPTPTVTPTPVVPLPTGVSLNKLSGHASNGRTVVLTGTNLLNLAGVQVAGAAVTDLQVLSPTQARFVLPAAADYQAKVAPITLTAWSDRTARPTPLTFEYRVTSRLDRQMAYAFQNWNAYSNRTFGYLSGNDCANFTSQTLLARGWKRSSEWFNNGPGRWSATWVSSTALSRWLKKRTDLATHLNYSQRDQVVVGDVIQFRWPGHAKTYTSWDHTAVVSKVVVLPNGRHDIYYVAHTLNRQYGGSTDGLARYYTSKKAKGSTLRMQFFHLKK